VVNAGSVGSKGVNRARGTGRRGPIARITKLIPGKITPRQKGEGAQGAKILLIRREEVGEKGQHAEAQKKGKGKKAHSSPLQQGRGRSLAWQNENWSTLMESSETKNEMLLESSKRRMFPEKFGGEKGESQ